VSPVEQHLATRRAAGLFDFSFMGRSVFNDATVWSLGGDRWWLFTGRRSDFGWIGARASARNRSGEYAILALQGPRSGAILSRVVGEAIVRALGYFRFLETGGMQIARLGYSGELGYELLVPNEGKERLRKTLLDAGRVDGLLECTFEAADSLRIECGYVLFDREIDGRANPSELGLEKLVIDPRPFETSRKLAGFEIIEGPSAELPPAQVTSECLSPSLGMRIALGFVAPRAGVGDRVRLEDGRAARVALLPFYDRDRTRPRVAPL
jgi:aminomethyltransferase